MTPTQELKRALRAAGKRRVDYKRKYFECVRKYDTEAAAHIQTFRQLELLWKGMLDIKAHIRAERRAWRIRAISQIVDSVLAIVRGVTEVKP